MAALKTEDIRALLGTGPTAGGLGGIASGGSGTQLAIGTGLSAITGSADVEIRIDPEQVPAAMLSKAEIDLLREMMAKSEAEAFHLANIVHDSVIIEMPPKPPKPPVTATRAVNALLAKPELAWAVLQGLHETKLLGPWVELDIAHIMKATGTTVPFKAIWSRECADPRMSVTVHFCKDRTFIVEDWVYPSTMSVAEVLVDVDVRLQGSGHILINQASESPL